MTKRLLAIETLCAFQAMGGGLVYSNDFSTRSSRAIPTGRWHEMPYHAGSLMQNYNNTAVGDGIAFAGRMGEGLLWYGGECLWFRDRSLCRGDWRGEPVRLLLL